MLQFCFVLFFAGESLFSAFLAKRCWYACKTAVCVPISHIRLLFLGLDVRLLQTSSHCACQPIVLRSGALRFVKYSQRVTMFQLNATDVYLDIFHIMCQLFFMFIRL